MSNENYVALDVEDRPAAPMWLALSLQHLFAMFGATVLVPILTGLSPAVALVSSGLGTLTYILVTGGRIPAYLGSSFAFIAPIIVAVQGGGVEAAMMGCLIAGLVYVAVSIGIKVFGINWLLGLLPPVVVGPVIMVIGLGLAGVAVNMATTGTGAPNGEYNGTFFMIALFTLLVAIVCAVYLKNFFSMVPILIGVLSGYVLALVLGLVDFGVVANAPIFAAPDFKIPFVNYDPNFNWVLILGIIAAAIVPIAEHIGDQMVLSKVVGRNFLKEPGLDKSLLGDGLATSLAAFLGGPPNTTYGENIGVLAVTRVFSVWVVGGAAVLAVLFGFIGKVSAII